MNGNKELFIKSLQIVSSELMDPLKVAQISTNIVVEPLRECNPSWIILKIWDSMLSGYLLFLKTTVMTTTVMLP